MQYVFISAVPNTQLWCSTRHFSHHIMNNLHENNSKIICLISCVIQMNITDYYLSQ